MFVTLHRVCGFIVCVCVCGFYCLCLCMCVWIVAMYLMTVDIPIDSVLIIYC